VRSGSGGNCGGCAAGRVSATGSRQRSH